MIIFAPLANDDTWQSAGDVAQTVLSDIAIKTKDRADEALDAQRITAGETIDEFFARQSKCALTGVPMAFCTCSGPHEGQK